MAYSGKTNWVNNEIVEASDMNRIEQGVTDNDTGLTTHKNNTSNPHQTTKAQVGLGNANNTSDIDKPVSTAQQAALDLKADKAATETEINNVQTQLNSKVDKVTGKGLSTNDYTTEEKTKLSGIATGAQVNVQSDWNASSGDAFIKNKPSSLPASDVYSWAKQATKPTYTANEVGALASNGTAVNSDRVDNKHIAVVSSMPASPNANTIYFVTT